ncbi:MAG TPA: ribonuclease III, partial [Caulobacteraceae bacterium]
MNARTEAVERLERRLGYAFTDRALLERALTHSSAAGGGKTRDNEVLEFVGDRVIGLLAAERLAQLHPEAP